MLNFLKKQPTNTASQVDETAAEYDLAAEILVDPESSAVLGVNYDRFRDEGFTDDEIGQYFSEKTKVNDESRLVISKVLNNEGRKVAQEIYESLFLQHNGDFVRIREQLAQDYEKVKIRLGADSPGLEYYRRIFQSLHGKLQYAVATELAAVEMSKDREDVSFKEALRQGQGEKGTEYGDRLRRANELHIESQLAESKLEIERLVYEAVKSQEPGVIPPVATNEVTVGEPAGERKFFDAGKALSRFKSGLRRNARTLAYNGLAATAIATMLVASVGYKGSSEPSQAIPQAITQEYTPPVLQIADSESVLEIAPVPVELKPVLQPMEKPTVESPIKITPEDSTPDESAVGVRETKTAQIETKKVIDGDEALINANRLVVFYPVSAATPVPESFSISEAPIAITKVEGMDVGEIIQASLTSLLADARAAGYSPEITSGYRSQEYQRWTREQAVNRQIELGKTREEAEQYTAQNSATPGYSEHHLGTAVDITDTPNGKNIWDNARENYNTGFYGWLRDHAHEYGFVLSYPTGADSTEQSKPGSGYVSAEPWHVRYIGKADAQKLFESGYLDPMNPITVDSYLRGLYEQAKLGGNEAVSYQVSGEYTLGIADKDQVVKENRVSKAQTVRTGKNQRVRQTMQAQKAKSQATAYQNKIDRRG